MIIEKSVDYLGKKVKDKITGRKGIVTSVCFDLYGCIQVVINGQKTNEKGEESTWGWIDINRLEVLKDKKIMERPDFSNKYKSIASVNGCDNSKPIN